MNLVRERGENGIQKFGPIAYKWNQSAFSQNVKVTDGTNFEIGKSAYTFLKQLDDSWTSSTSGVGSFRAYGDVTGRDIGFSEIYWEST